MSDTLQRFSLWRRIEHVSVMSTFTLLALTGFPQKFYESGWASSIVNLFNGIAPMRSVHRACGWIFTALLLLHFAVVGLGLVQRRYKDLAMVPTRRDFVDAIVTLKFYLGLSKEEAKFGRYDYRQKFEYWGLIMGSILMVGTGLVLIFPLPVAQYLLGEFIPAAKVAHSNEGLMAFLVVILWHIYNAHFNPDVFPFDKSIFTGKISRHRMEHEHPLELEQLDAEKKSATPPPAAAAVPPAVAERREGD